MSPFNSIPNTGVFHIFSNVYFYVRILVRKKYDYDVDHMNIEISTLDEKIFVDFFSSAHYRLLSLCKSNDLKINRV